MEIKSFEINGLFGYLNHKIPLMTDSGITIIIGENGLGKTITLNLISAFFNEDYTYFSEVEFDSFWIEFSDGKKWEVTYINNELSVQLYKSNGDKLNNPVILMEGIDRGNMFYINNNKYIYENEIFRSNIRSSSNFERIEHILPKRRFSRSGHMMFSFPDVNRKWFLKKMKLVRVDLIKTQRLIDVIDNKDESDSSKDNRVTVEKYSKELVDIIENELSNSTILSNKLDRSYPNRLLSSLNSSSAKKITRKMIISDYELLEKKRALLNEVGLVDTENDDELISIDEILKLGDEKVNEVLYQYVKDSLEKVKIHDVLSAKLSLLLKIVNMRFKHKKLVIDKKRGFVFQSTVESNKKKHKTIPVNSLSSGEQNELVLFYELIFKTSPGAMILIDEPEISLHIKWQNMFIDDLKEIHKINNLNVIIATHSPDIIGNNFRLKVELKGIE